MLPSGSLGITVTGVVSDRPGVLALERAKRAGIPALTVDHAQAGSSAAFQSELGTVLAELEPNSSCWPDSCASSVLDWSAAWAGRMLNVHPSLLPKYPGLHTYRRALEAGEQEHGSTVHFVIPELDAGPGILQYRVSDPARRHRRVAACPRPARRVPDLPPRHRLVCSRPPGAERWQHVAGWRAARRAGDRRRG